ncbi:MAG TPA: preprotein translocase subunit SecY [Candidatus Syntrophoarchaeum butanivorans]|uniref:Protein translocase subunit SecY n=1 Tax=Candidatus Syntropharchaeum butanivorans TaxID=1839936 RepID=A0A7C0X466_9EURY|nr:preprotein translocase subunit SecY [Candidatus Syntrophoarchaeum butanivorans]
MNEAEYDFKDRIAPILKRFPAIERPAVHVHFKRKLGWTISVLILYFVLSNIPLFGLSPDSIDLFAQYRAFFAGASGSIVLLGIGPIVTASIVLQLLVGADIIKLDLSNPRDQAIFQGTQKILVLVMIVLETLPQMVGANPYIKPDLSLGIDPTILWWALFIQIFIGGVLIMFLDEIVSKWGIGSGVGLFIVAGVAQALMTGVFNWERDQGMPIGLIPKWIWIAQNMGGSELLSGEGIKFLLIQGGVLALFTTIIIFLLVIFFESTRVEIPLAHSAVRGARGKFPVKLIYASVLPMILVRALQANIQMFGMIMARRGSTFLGVYDPQTGRPISGLMYYLNPIHSPYDWIPSLVHMNHPEIATWQIAVRLGCDLGMMIIGGMIFAIFWINTTNMGADAVARQIQRTGMQIPGFRRDPRILEKVLERYIPKVTILGGALVGLLVVLANMLGTLGHATGTGILLAVSIVYRLYEEIASEQMMEMHPMIRSFFGKE